MDLVVVGLSPGMNNTISFSGDLGAFLRHVHERQAAALAEFVAARAKVDKVRLALGKLADAAGVDIRVHGGYGYSTEFDVERYFRDAFLMIVGEGTNEIQRNVIAATRPTQQPADLSDLAAIPEMAGRRLRIVGSINRTTINPRRPSRPLRLQSERE